MIGRRHKARRHADRLIARHGADAWVQARRIAFHAGGTAGEALAWAVVGEVGERLGIDHHPDQRVRRDRAERQRHRAAHVGGT